MPCMYSEYPGVGVHTYIGVVITAYCDETVIFWMSLESRYKYEYVLYVCTSSLCTNDKGSCSKPRVDKSI
jgi:hypothetical protein